MLSLRCSYHIFASTSQVTGYNTIFVCTGQVTVWEDRLRNWVGKYHIFENIKISKISWYFRYFPENENFE